MRILFKDSEKQSIFRKVVFFLNLKKNSNISENWFLVFPEQKMNSKKEEGVCEFLRENRSTKIK